MVGQLLVFDNDRDHDQEDEDDEPDTNNDAHLRTVGVVSNVTSRLD